MANVNDRVRFDEGEGIVEEVYQTRTGQTVYIVKKGDVRYKVTEVEVIEAPEVISITEEEFNEAVASVLDPANYESMEKSSKTIVTVTGGMICELLRRELFG